MYRIFYHGDPDGICSAALVRNYLHLDDEECKFYEMQYNILFPMYDIEFPDIVFIVDFSIRPDEMKELLDITPNVYWIDHHISAIDKYKGFHYISKFDICYGKGFNDFADNIMGLRRDGVAGCKLVWEFFQQYVPYFLYEDKIIKLNVDKLAFPELPIIVDYVADWDVFKLDYGESTKQFILGFNAKGYKPTDLSKASLRSIQLQSCLIDDGATIQNYVKMLSKDADAFEVNIDGFKGLALNIPFKSSLWYTGIDGYEDYDFLISYCYMSNGRWNYSIYDVSRNKFDCQEYAKRFGGGGHRGAAGMITDEFIIPYIMKTES